MMRTTRTLMAILALVLAMIIAAAGAFAQPINFSEVVPDLTATADDGREIIVRSRMIQLLGLDMQGRALIYINGEYLTVDAAAIKGLLSAADYAALRRESEFQTIARGYQGDIALELQLALQQLGYLDASAAADGVFGLMSVTAMQAFQAAQSMPLTDEFDPRLQMLLLSMAEKQLDVKVVDARTLYAQIADRTSANLDGVYDAGLTFDYDEFTGEGLIYDGTALQVDASGEADIDWREFSVKVGLYVSENAEGTVDVTPAILIDCSCARRPMMTDIIMKSGDTRLGAKVSKLTNDLSGARSVEHAVIPLDQDGAAMLSGAEDANELRLRVNGRYESFDIAFPADSLDNVAKIGALAQGL